MTSKRLILPLASHGARSEEAEDVFARRSLLHDRGAAEAVRLMRAKAAIVLAEAADDLAAGVTFYDSQAQGIGRCAFDDLHSDIESRQLYAGIQSAHFGFRRMQSRRFLFAIYDDVQDGMARVAAVLEMPRDPAWIREELNKRNG